MKTSTIRRAAAAAAVIAAATTGLTIAAGPADARSTARPAPACGNAALAVTRTFVQGAAGHSGLALIYRNATTHACSVTGYPGVDAVSRTGRVLSHAARTHDAAPRTVTIKPAGFASATLQWRDFSAGTGRACPASSSIATIVADTTRVHRLPVAAGTCGLEVGPTVAGVPGYPHYAQAQFDWLTVASVDAAGRAQFVNAVADELKAARVYPTQYAQARQLAGFPETGLTDTQLAQARTDVTALDAFFATTAV